MGLEHMELGQVGRHQFQDYLLCLSISITVFAELLLHSDVCVIKSFFFLIDGNVFLSVKPIDDDQYLDILSLISD